MMNEVLAGIDIGGTKIAIAFENSFGEKVAQRLLSSQSEAGPYAVIENVFLAIEEMLAEGGYRLSAVGVGSPGPLDVEKGMIMSPSNLLEWSEFPVVRLFGERFRVPVLLDNDANAAALGEYIYGAGKGYRNIVYVTVSTGVGGGIIIDGEIVHGVNHGAGEIGHTIVNPDSGIRCFCGSVGCLEAICAGSRIAQRAKDRLIAGEQSAIRELVSEIEEVSAKTVIEAVRLNDRLATEIWSQACRYLAIGVANIFTLLAPEAVIVGGGIAAAGELLFEPLRRIAPEFVSQIPHDKINIVPAQLGTESGVCGALVLARKAHSNSYQTNAAQQKQFQQT